MKKTNIVIAVLAAICCASIVIAGFALHFGLYAKEHIEELYSCYKLDNMRMDRIEDEIGSDADFGPFTTEGTVHTATISSNLDYLCLKNGVELEAVAAINMTIPENNSDPNSDRYYWVEDTLDPGYLIFKNPNNQILFVTVIVS